MKEKIEEESLEKKARKAVVTLLKWLGEDPLREGLLDTPDRFLRSFREQLSGYQLDPRKVLQKGFFETGNYQNMIVLSGILVESYCEHHLAPFTGYAKIGYIPRDKVVGISKLARVVEIFAKRLQLQERLTQEIGSTIFSTIQPLGVAVLIEATHNCMTKRGVKQPSTLMTTQSYFGSFQENRLLIEDFLKSK